VDQVFVDILVGQQKKSCIHEHPSLKGSGGTINSVQANGWPIVVYFEFIGALHCLQLVLRQSEDD
jgi:hypothetical protein